MHREFRLQKDQDPSRQQARPHALLWSQWVGSREKGLYFSYSPGQRMDSEAMP